MWTFIFAVRYCISFHDSPLIYELGYFGAVVVAMGVLNMWYAAHALGYGNPPGFLWSQYSTVSDGVTHINDWHFEKNNQE